MEEYGGLIALAQLYLLEQRDGCEFIESSKENWNLLKLDVAIPNSKRTEQPPPPPSAFQPSAPMPAAAVPAAPPKPQAPLPRPQVKNPPPANEEPPVSKSGSSFFKLDPFPLPEGEALEDIKVLYKERFPSQAILDHPPADEEAKAALGVWKQQSEEPEIAILSFGEPPPQRLFLQNLAKALRIRAGSSAILDARQIEEKNQWQAHLGSKCLRLVIACDYAIYSLNGLMPHYQEKQGNLRLLNETPLLLISDLSST